MNVFPYAFFFSPSPSSIHHPSGVPLFFHLPTLHLIFFFSWVRKKTCIRQIIIFRLPFFPFFLQIFLSPPLSSTIAREREWERDRDRERQNERVNERKKEKKTKARVRAVGVRRRKEAPNEKKDEKTKQRKKNHKKIMRKKKPEASLECPRGRRKRGWRWRRCGETPETVTLLREIGWHVSACRVVVVVVKNPTLPSVLPPAVLPQSPTPLPLRRHERFPPKRDSLPSLGRRFTSFRHFLGLRRLRQFRRRFRPASWRYPGDFR